MLLLLPEKVGKLVAQSSHLTLISVHHSRHSLHVACELTCVGSHRAHLLHKLRMSPEVSLLLLLAHVAETLHLVHVRIAAQYLCRYLLLYRLLLGIGGILVLQERHLLLCYAEEFRYFLLPLLAQCHHLGIAAFALLLQLLAACSHRRNALVVCIALFHAAARHLLCRWQGRQLAHQFGSRRCRTRRYHAVPYYC